MTKNPYADSKHLAELLWETELVADRYSNGGLMLIKTKGGWRAFLGTFKEETLREIERFLDKNVPSFEKSLRECFEIQVSQVSNLNMRWMLAR